MPSSPSSPAPRWRRAARSARSCRWSATSTAVSTRCVSLSPSRACGGICGASHPRNGPGFSSRTVPTRSIGTDSQLRRHGGPHPHPADPRRGLRHAHQVRQGWRYAGRRLVEVRLMRSASLHCAASSLFPRHRNPRSLRSGGAFPPRGYAPSPPFFRPARLRLGRALSWIRAGPSRPGKSLPSSSNATGGKIAA